MKAFWTVLAILAALLVQSALTRMLPTYARIFDPFLLVLVYCGLTGGEIHGMLAGAAAGWVQDIHFGGSVLGLSGLTKVLVGFAVGLAGARFQLSEPGPRLLVLLAAALLDALIFSGLAAAFDVPTHHLPPAQMAARAMTCAVLGVLAFELIERRLPRAGRG